MKRLLKRIENFLYTYEPRPQQTQMNADPTKTPGQVSYEATISKLNPENYTIPRAPWERLSDEERASMEAGAAAVIAHHEAERAQVTTHSAPGIHYDVDVPTPPPPGETPTP